jgi:hypothetical protein
MSIWDSSRESRIDLPVPTFEFVLNGRQAARARRGGIAMVWNKQKLKTAVVACFVALVLATNDFSFARSTQLHLVLQQIAPLLAKIGIGVFCCGAKAHGKGARVGLLEDMRFKRMPKDRLESQAWEEKFRLGAMNEEFNLGRIGIILFGAPSEAELGRVDKFDPVTRGCEI